MFSTLADALTHNRETQNSVLDLGKLGLKGHEPELEQLHEFFWAEELNFSSGWTSVKQKAWIDSQNEGERNKLTCLPPCLPPRLQALFLHGQIIHDFSFLSGLTDLTYLNLGYNEIRDISFLSGFTGLTSLGLEANGIVDISFLAGLTGLTSLNLQYNQIRDISFLSNLTNLTYLDLACNEIHDISFLSGLIKLNTLMLHSNQIKHFSFALLSNFPQLETLYLWDNPIQNLPPEIAGAWFTNCLTSVRHYFEDFGIGKA
jgi:Leucine-rich repeat (LRR) protein